MAQESWKREKKKTEWHAPEGLILCVNNCGFFGSPATMNLRFKCYSEVILLKAPGSCGMEKLPEVFSIQRPDLVLPEEVQFAFRRPNDGSGSSCSAVGVRQEPQQPIRQTSFQSLTFLEVMQVLDHANHDYQALHTAALSG